MDFTFAIPLSKDDLMSGDGEKYVVQEVYSVRTLSNRLDGKCVTGYDMFLHFWSKDY